MAHRRVLCLSLVLALLGAAPLRAHRLTGTDVATVAQLLVDGSAVSGTYELQYGELAALEERRRMDADADGRVAPAEQQAYLEKRGSELAQHLALLVDGEALAVRLDGGEVTPDEPLVVPAQMTVRFALSCAPAEFARRRLLRFRDSNAQPRLVHADVWVEGTPLVDISVVQGTQGALKQIRVQSPAVPVEADVVVEPSQTVWQSPAFGMPTRDAAPRQETQPGGASRLQSVLRRGDLSAGVVLVALGLAVFLGAAHALEPGHGKTLVAAYLVGARGTVANAVFLGAVVTFTHTFSVILLGLVTLFASRYVLPEQIFPWLGTGSGLLVAGLGVWLYTRSIRGEEHAHVHAHPHPHDEPRFGEHGAAPHHGGHSHAVPRKVTLGGLLTLGISGGLVPCPGALVILLLAVALHRIALGLALVVLFSVGLAAVLIGLGVLMVRARPLVERLSSEGRVLRTLPVVSAALVTLVGLAMAARSLVEAGIVVIRL